MMCLDCNYIYFFLINSNLICCGELFVIFDVIDFIF